MGKKLVITEKPSVARDFARVLGVSGSKDGFIENEEYIVSWCYGHLVEMVYPEVYDAKYKTWNLEDLPFLPQIYQYGVVESAKKQYAIVNGLLHRKDVETVYWAGDSGKEGQTIEENIRNYGGVREGITELRVWIDSQTDEEIRRGIREARPMSDYALLGQSGIMRTIEDYSLGINFSRALSVKYGRMINDAAATKSYTAIAIGRVMTCVLGMVVNREREIRNFTETPFFKIIGSFSPVQFKAEWKAVPPSAFTDSPGLYKENGFRKREDAQRLILSLQGQMAKIDSIERSVSKKKAPLLFNLAELQAECARIFKISPAQTLNVVQDLYERKFTTYPRTDARVLTKAIAKEISKNLYGLRGVEPVAEFVKDIIDHKKYIGLEKTQYTDDSKVTDHYAIIPTGQTRDLEKLPPLHLNVYQLILKRFLSIFYPPAEYAVVKIVVKIGRESFFTSQKKLIKPGYMEIAGIFQAKNSGDGEEEDNTSVDFETLVKKFSGGDEVSVNGFDLKEGKTSPPKRYTSGSMILAMENAGNLIEDEELREQIKKSGIGTSATRGEILDKLVRIHYLNQNGKTQIITPSNLGEMIYEVVKLSVPSLLNPEMTASWEKGLDGITNGTVDYGIYRQKLENYIRTETTKMIQHDLTQDIAHHINRFTGAQSKGIATRKPLGLKCPDCGGELTTTAFGYGCSNYFKDEIKCKFSVGQIAGVDLSEEDFRELVTGGKTRVIDGFVSKSKRKYKSALALRVNEQGKHEISFDFSQVPEEYLEGAQCPACGGRILRTPYGYACENRNQQEKNCSFSVGEISGHKVSKEEMLSLLGEGKTEVIRGFKSKAGNVFQARLLLEEKEEKKFELKFDFEDIEPEYVEGVVCPDCGSKIAKKGQGFGCSAFRPEKADSCKFFIGKIAGKQIGEALVKELLTAGKTRTVRGFKAKSGKKFDACLKLEKDEDGKSRIGFDFENVEAKVIKGIACPICGGEIVKTSFGYGCKNYDRRDPEHSCKFRMGEVASIKLNDRQIKELLTEEKTSLIAGFKSKNGNKFEAHLSLDRDEKGVVKGCKFVFPNPDVEMQDVRCPKCDEPMVKTRFGYRCRKYNKEDGCSFYVGQIAGVMLTKEQLHELITEKHTDRISGFTSKAGNQFEAALKLDENYHVVFDFDYGNKQESIAPPNSPADMENRQEGQETGNGEENNG